MVSCRNCKHFVDEKVAFFCGLCTVGQMEDFIEEEMADDGECECYEPLDADNTEE